MSKILPYIALYAIALPLAVVAGAMWAGVPLAFAWPYVAQATLYAVPLGAWMGWMLRRAGTVANVVINGIVLLAVGYPLSQGGFAEAASAAFCWGIGFLVLITLAGGIEKFQSRQTKPASSSAKRDNYNDQKWGKDPTRYDPD